MSDESKTLQEIGELNLIEEVILPLAKSFEEDLVTGDDCAFVNVNEGATLALSTDVGPKPIISSLKGYENDLEAAGWHAVVATASDIATSGATPLYLTNCIDAEPHRTVSDFKEYLKGYLRACAELGFKNAGGDVRHGPKLSIRVSGAGVLASDYKVDRSSAEKNDRLVVIGPAGQFMATYLLARQRDSLVFSNSELTEEASEILRFPRPQLGSMSELVRRDLIVSASDSSDSLLGAIDNIAKSSKCGVHLELDDHLLTPLILNASDISGYDPWNIFFCWGDWSVASVVREKDFERFQSVCHELNISWSYLGRITDTANCFSAETNSGTYNLNIVRNENFIERGFNAGLDGHLEYILGSKILF